MKLTVHIKGIRPLILHNGQTSDPLNPFAKMIKKVAGKRNKTDDDYEEMGKIEFEASLYWSSDLGLYIPADNLQRMILDGAKKLKLGRQAGAAQVDHEFGVPLKTPDSDNLDKLKANTKLYFRKSVTVNGSKVVRTRAMIPTGWGLAFKIDLDTSTLEKDQFADIMGVCSTRVGLGDWRPGAPKVPGIFGKFVVEKISNN